MESDNIYEFDLQSFFPSVIISEIEKIMIEKLGIPSKLAHSLMEMHRSVTKIPAEIKMAENSDLNVLLTPSDNVNPNLDPSLKAKVAKALKQEGEERTAQLEKILPEG